MKPTITVHHVKEPLDPAKINLYCGRGNAPAGMVNAKMGNPFVMKDQSEAERHRVCDAYDKWLRTNQAAGHLRVMERMIQRVNEGKTLALYCHCSPKKCHCDTIREYVLTNVDFG
jgi:hypothetical protein